MKNVFFFAEHLYYLPQYAPVYWKLRHEGVQCRVLALDNPANTQLLKHVEASMGLPLEPISESDLTTLIQQEKPDWCVFGNVFNALPDLKGYTKTALLYHGIGIKASYYSEWLQGFDVRFTEGDFRQQQLTRLFPAERFVSVGFTKLDPLFGFEQMPPVSIELAQMGLDPKKPTLLYAPTFYPSSVECLPSHWPKKVEGHNLIIKPHLMSYTHKAYQAQRRLFDEWAQHDNVYLAPAHEVSLLPYMAVADVLLSEASSALFEFAALNKPVIWLDFFKLRWSYRGVFSYRFKNRMDQTIAPYFNIGAHAKSAQEVDGLIDDALRHPEAFAAERATATRELIGPTDGACASRIVEYFNTPHRARTLSQALDHLNDGSR